MSDRYSSARQEEFYQPWRLMVLKHHHRSSHYGSGWTDYRVAKVNTASHDVLLYGKDGEWKAINADDLKVPTKAEAMDLAKRLAENHALPFDLSSGYADYDDVVRGPVLECLICGDRIGKGHWGSKRGHERDVCDDCRKAALAAKAGEDDGEDVAVPRLVLDKPGDYNAYRSDPMGESYEDQLVLALLGIAVPDDVIERHNDWRGKTILDKYQGFGQSVFLARTQSWRVETMKRAIDIIQKMLDIAFRQGRLEGSGMLKQLVQGTMHPRDLSEVRENDKARK